MKHDEFLDLFDKTFEDIQRCKNKYAGRAILHLILGQMLKHIKITRGSTNTFGHIDPRIHVIWHFSPGSGRCSIGNFIEKVSENQDLKITILDSDSSFDGIISEFSNFNSDIILYPDFHNFSDSYVGRKLTGIFDGCMNYKDVEYYTKGNVVIIKPEMSFIFGTPNTLNEIYNMEFARNTIIIDNQYEPVRGKRIDIRKITEKDVLHNYFLDISKIAKHLFQVITHCRHTVSSTFHRKSSGAAEVLSSANLRIHKHFMNPDNCYNGPNPTLEVQDILLKLAFHNAVLNLRDMILEEDVDYAENLLFSIHAPFIKDKIDHEEELIL